VTRHTDPDSQWNQVIKAHVNAEFFMHLADAIADGFARLIMSGGGYVQAVRENVLVRAAPLHDQIICAARVTIGDPTSKDTMPITVTMNRTSLLRAQFIQLVIVDVHDFGHDAPFTAWMNACTFTASFLPG